MYKLGLVGGISWVSTIDYYRYINEGINKELGGINFAECLIYSINFADIHKVGWENTFDLLYEACLSLKNGGADAIVLCANTAHIFSDELQIKIKLPVIDIVTATLLEVKRNNLSKVALLGTKYTMELGFYKNRFDKAGVELIIPKEKTIREFIQDSLVNELGKGVISNKTKEEYKNIINTLIDDGAQGVIFACTEIPVFFKQDDFRVPVFDTTKIHADAAVKFALTNC